MNRQELLDRQYSLLSTQTQKKFRFETLLQSYIAADRTWVDPCSPKMMQLLAIPRTLILIYDRATPVTTYSVQIYGTSNLWHLIVSCSGYIHPHVIPRGHTFKIPTINAVIETMKEKTESLAGKIIEF